MARSLLLRFTCVSLLLLGLAAAPGSARAEAKYGDPEFTCVSSKQTAAGAYAKAALEAWADWERSQNAAKRDAALARAADKLAHEFALAEATSSRAGVDCVEQTETAAQLAARIDATLLALVDEINSGLDLADRGDANCGADLVKAAALKIHSFLLAEGKHTKQVPAGGDAAKREEEQARASEKFSAAWARAACPTDADEGDIEGRLDALSRDVVFHTVVAPQLDDSEFQPVSPTGPIEYEGRTLDPRCGFDDDPDYHFFVKRGSVNKVVMYYQGGGACWENLTCSIPVCKDGADPVSDDPDNFSGGFGDVSNPDNPFKDWNVVFVTYCTCDIHFGDVDQTYTGLFPPINVSHRGFQNAKVAEKFARENFLNPDVVFVTGSSAGGYGALFHGPLLHDVWPLAEFKVLGDASNGVITPGFLQNEFNNWNFTANLPDDVPGVIDSITSGEGMVAFIDAVADYYPETTWANYTTAYDGGTGGQTGFYNVMLNNNNPAAALSWWQGSCQFNDVMVDQATDTFTRAPENYRYYIGSGSRHTMYGSDKIYTDQTGGASQTIVDWVADMIAFDPLTSPAGDWQNVSCANCGVLLPGDPAPPVIPTPPFFPFFGKTVVSCPAP
jgi:hypothetical protein